MKKSASPRFSLGLVFGCSVLLLSQVAPWEAWAQQGVCEAWKGENCVEKPTECRSKLSGNGKYCCGDGEAPEIPLGVVGILCTDARCRQAGYQCEATQPGVDAGVPAVDAGVPAVDAGVPAVDAGVPAVDASVPGVDATVPVDASVAHCGNGTCEPDLGENCTNCTECRGVQNGSPRRQFCCGNGFGSYPVDCSDLRCTSDGWACEDSNPPITPPPGGGGGGVIPPGDTDGSCVDPLASAPPDELDVFKINTCGITEAMPRIEFLLDDSSSMNSNAGAIATTCGWFADKYNSGDTSLKRMQRILAVLVGCESENDGLLDIFAGQFLFAARGLLSGPLLNNPVFTADAATMQAALVGPGSVLTFGQNTPAANGLASAAEDFNSNFNGSNTSACGDNYIIYLSKGNFSGCDQPTYTDCDFVSVNPVESCEGQSVAGAEFLAGHDMLCNVDGDQSISTYTVGIDTVGGQAPGLQKVAGAGKGEFRQADSVEELRAALVEIFSAIAARNSVSFSLFTVERDDSFFTGKYAYLTSYAPQPNGMFWGNLKKACVLPEFDLVTGYEHTPPPGCMFYVTADEPFVLRTNPASVDVWTGSSSPNTDEGGAGKLLKERLNNPANYWPRTILTWNNVGPWGEPSTNEYFRIDRIDENTPENVKTRHSWNSYVTLGELPSFVNRVHGYTFGHDRGTGASYGRPVDVQEWPFGDSVHAPPILLKYGDCTEPNVCWILSIGNDGMIHFIDGATGEETSAVVPPDIQNPYSGASKRLLRDIDRQPSVAGIHNYYIDGGARLYHEDDDADGVIDETERAYLIVALGRGGRAYYRIPVSKFNGTLSSAENAVQALTHNPSNSFDDLHETWAAPWLGRASLSTDAGRPLAIFPSGHVQAYDFATQMMPAEVSGPGTIDWSTSVPCAEFADANGLADFCGIDNTYYPPPLPPTPPGYPDVGLPRSWGPLSYPRDQTQVTPIAFRLIFSSANRFDLEPADYLELTDSQGALAGAWTSTGVASTGDEWALDVYQHPPVVFDSSFYLHWRMDGIPTDNRGYEIDSVQVALRRPDPPEFQSPGIYFVDLETWSGSSTPPSDSGVVLRVTRDCTRGPAGRCVDRNALGAEDLKYMTCPISAEPSVYQQGDRVKAVYFGDECGQIWKISPDYDSDRVNVTRLLSTNRGDFSDLNVNRESRNIRKIFRRIDLVLSTCPGRRVMGIYFGTGNVQRPTATDELGDPLITDGRDIVGLVWDDDLIRNLTLDDLTNIDSPLPVDQDATTIYANGSHGWFWNLEDDEKMLRDPLVYLGTAFFKTHSPEGTSATNACTNSVGTDRTYGVDNCTGSPIAGQPGRVVWEGNQDIGGDLQIFTPKEGDSFVTTGNMAVDEVAGLTSANLNKSINIFWWRLPKGYE